MIPINHRIHLVQHELVKIRYRWTEADSTSDNYLDLDEFLIFRHPEITGNSYKYVVDDIILQMGTFLFSSLGEQIDHGFSSRS